MTPLPATSKDPAKAALTRLLGTINRLHDERREHRRRHEDARLHKLGRKGAWWLRD